MMDDRKIADVINAVRDIAIAFHGAEQLRARLSDLLIPHLKKISELETRLHEHEVAWKMFAGEVTASDWSDEDENETHAMCVRWLRGRETDRARIGELEKELGRVIVNLPPAEGMRTAAPSAGVLELRQQRDTARLEAAEAQALNREMLDHFRTVERELASHLPATARSALVAARRSGRNALTAALAQARREERTACFCAADAAFATEHVLNAIRAREPVEQDPRQLEFPGEI